MLTFEQIKELIEMVADRRLQSLEVERSGFKLTIGGHGAPSPVVAAPSAEILAAPAVAGSPATVVAAPAPTAAAPAEPEDEHADAHVLTSPIVGTFYEAPSPDAEPFVRVGDRVREGQVLCIVEAMKLMNEIEADVSGEVVKVVPKNGQPVEFGEPLFAIKV